MQGTPLFAWLRAKDTRFRFLLTLPGGYFLLNHTHAAARQHLPGAREAGQPCRCANLEGIYREAAFASTSLAWASGKCSHRLADICGHCRLIPPDMPSWMHSHRACAEVLNTPKLCTFQSVKAFRVSRLFFLDPTHHKQKHMDTPGRHMAACTRSGAAAPPGCPLGQPEPPTPPDSCSSAGAVAAVMSLHTKKWLCFRWLTVHMQATAEQRVKVTLQNPTTSRTGSASEPSERVGSLRLQI